MTKSQWVQNEHGSHGNLILGVNSACGFIFASYVTLLQNAAGIITKRDNYFIRKQKRFCYKMYQFIINV